MSCASVAFSASMSCTLRRCTVCWWLVALLQLAGGAQISDDTGPLIATPDRIPTGESALPTVFPSAAEYLLDNSQLKSPNAGITYRRSTNMADKDEGHYEPYGSIVSGFDQGDGWLQVGRSYLPMSMQGKPVLALQAPAHSRSSSRVVEHPTAKPQAYYMIDKSKLKNPHKGIAYRRSKDMNDKDGHYIAPYGSIVRGSDEGDGWLRLGDRYLPMEVGGKAVVIIPKEHEIGPDEAAGVPQAAGKKQEHDDGLDDAVGIAASAPQAAGAPGSAEASGSVDVDHSQDGLWMRLLAAVSSSTTGVVSLGLGLALLGIGLAVLCIVCERRFGARLRERELKRDTPRVPVERRFVERPSEKPARLPAAASGGYRRQSAPGGPGSLPPPPRQPQRAEPTSEGNEATEAPAGDARQSKSKASRGVRSLSSIFERSMPERSAASASSGPEAGTSEGFQPAPEGGKEQPREEELPNAQQQPAALIDSINTA